MKKTKAFYKVVVLAVSAFLLFSVNALAVSEEAKRHFDRGMAAVEMAKSQDDYAPAIKEFEQAIRLAPEWPDVYYNLGMVQEKAGKYRDAITSLKQYLRLAPNSNEAAEVKSLINKLEFKAEQEITREEALDIFGSLSDTTKWRFVGDSSAYKNLVKGFRRDGDRIFITYIYDIIKGTTFTTTAIFKSNTELTSPIFPWEKTKSTSGKELEGKTPNLVFIVTFFNFCDIGPDCHVFGKYIFKIVSKNKVQVEAGEIWPKIRPYVEQRTEHLTFEYIRIQ